MSSRRRHTAGRHGTRNSRAGIMSHRPRYDKACRTRQAGGAAHACPACASISSALHQHIMHLQLSSRMQEQQPHLLPMPPSQNTDPGQPTPMEIEELSDSEGLYGDAGWSTGGSKPHAAAAQRDDTAGDGERLGGHQLLHFSRLPMLAVVSASYMRNRCSPSSALSQSAEPEGCVVPNTFVPSSCSFRCEHGHAAPARCSSRA